MTGVVSLRYCTALILLISGCGAPTAPPLPTLPAPRWVPRTHDTAATETGVRPWPEASADGVGGIRLEWHALNPLEVGGYRIYRSDTTDANGTPTRFTELVTLEYGTTAEDTAYVDRAVQHWHMYHYRVHALDRSPQRREGPPSEITRFMLEPPPIPIAPVGEVHPDSVVFRWSNNVGYVVLRVFEADTSNPDLILHPVWVFAGAPMDYSNPRIRYNQDGRAKSLHPGRLYRWRISRVTPGRPERGATSIWRTFWVKQ
ncbi:MAG: hypothetical protein NZ473_06080 [Candidatus Kapabacteria bacterium]|nr:hypothetical protein [Candidatus Kapabacteria bacterium]MDW8225883.1 hypothetical protein [Bacteroidota bacterium]